MDSEVSDIKKQYSNDKKESIEESKENRRSNRIECIISILAITVTVCGGMFSFSKYVLNILPNTLSFFYIFLWGVILYIFASVLIVFYDIVMFVWKEIKRHDILDDKCSLYDNESDKAYNKITGDFSFHLLILGVLFCIFIFTFIYDALLKILVVIVFSPLIIFLIINFIRKKILTNEKVVAFIKKKKEAIINKLQPIIDWFSPRIKKIYKKIRIFFSPLYWFISVTVLIVYYIVKIPIYYLVITPVYYTIKLVYKVVRFFIKSKFYDGIKKFIITGYIGLILFVIIITFNYIGNSKIEMTYNTDGTLIFNVSSNKDFGAIDVYIYPYIGSSENDEYEGWYYRFDKKDMLMAAEMTFEKEIINQNNKMDDLVNYNTTKYYWKKIFNINECIKEDGKYIVIVEIEQGIGKVRVTNMFVVKNGVYEFGQNSISKSF